MSKPTDMQPIPLNPYPSIPELREAIKRGINISMMLAERYPRLTRSEVIEIAYDLQAGSYTEIALTNPGALEGYAREIHELCKPYLDSQDVILDCGAGELTTLSPLSQLLPPRCQLLACDISLSRLKAGKRFAQRFMRTNMAEKLSLFVADIAKLPLPSNSVDVVFTSHALEPNHGREKEMLNEMVRVARRQLLLFEPSWENANEEVRRRMDMHGYVRDLPMHIDDIGGRLVAVKPLPAANPANPTYCYIIDLPLKNVISPSHRSFHCPRSGFPLQKKRNYWWSPEGGWAYPEIDGIPCLREKHGVLMSHA